jgi:hypothetical protein
MRIEDGKRRAFWGYLNSFRFLEQAFRAAGMNVDISFSLHRNGDKYLCIENGHDCHILVLNKLTPEQAIKEAACFLVSGHYSIFCEYPRVIKEKQDA